MHNSRARSQHHKPNLHILSVALIVVFFLSLSSLAVGQSLPFKDYGSDEGFQNWASVHSIFQDREGYIWIGTMDGVYRYDSQNFVFYSPDVNTNNPAVLCITQDHNGVLWVGTASGGLFSYNGESFEEYPLPEIMKGGQIWTLQVDADNQLWIGSVAGVAKINESGFTDFFNRDDSPSYVLDMQFDKEQRLWICLSWALVEYRDDQFFDVTESFGLPKNTVMRDLYMDAEGTLYLGSDVGAFRLEDGHAKPELIGGQQYSERVNSIVKDKTGALWLGAQAGAFRLREGGKDWYSTSTGLADDYINKILLDKEGSLWFASQGGLSSLPSLDFEWFRTFEGLPGNHVSALSVGSDGTLRGGTYGNGVFYMRDDEVTSLTYPDKFPLKRLLSVLEDSQGRIWYGAMEGLVYEVDQLYTPVVMADGTSLISCLYLFEDNSGRIWVTLDYGVAYFDDGVFHKAPEEWGISDTQVRCIVQSQEGALYFGTMREGVIKIEDGQRTNIVEEDGLASNTVFDATIDEDGAFWFATWNGLSRIKDGVITTFPVGCVDNLSRSFSIETLNGRVYSGTTLGLVELDPSTGKYQILNSNDGMLATESTRACLTSQSGKLWIGSREGLMRFNPEYQSGKEVPPPISITEVRLSQGDVLFGNSARLGYKQNSLRFSFQGRHFSNPQSLYYRYRLLGAGSDWLETTEVSVLYPFLPPGNYTFQVVAVVEYGLESVTPAQFFITIDQPIWQTWVFRVALFLILIALIVTIVRVRTKNMRLRNVMLLHRIEERRKAQEEQARLAAAIEQAAEAIVITDANGKIQYVNPASVKLRGFAAEECIGKDANELWLLGYDEETGEEFRRDLRGGMVWQGQLTNVMKNGRRIRVEGTISPVFDENGHAINFVSVMRDITREMALETQLNHAHRMEAVGQLAGGVAHDFNNLLQAIMGYLDFTLAENSLDEDVKEHLQDARSASKRAADLVRQLLLFSRREAPRVEPIQLNEVIDNLGKMLNRVIGKHIELNISSASDLATVNADPGQIEQIVMNLCVNARDAMPDGGVLEVELANVTFSEDFVADNAWAKPGEFVELVVRDTGAGISPEIREHIFEPFFTTKERGKGTGMGLATVYGIVNQHNGFINIESEKGEGSTFKLYFPVTEDKIHVEQKIEEKRSAPLPKGNGTILFAEDEEMVRSIAVRLLEKSGYTVLVAENGEEALQIFDEAPDLPDAFLLDVIMPKMSGAALASIIFERRPNARVLFCSGYSSDMLDEDAFPNQGYKLLHKPYSPRELLNALNELLAEPEE